MIEVYSPETVILLNIQNEDCFVSIKWKQVEICQTGLTETIVLVLKAGVWIVKELLLADTLPLNQPMQYNSGHSYHHTQDQHH